MARTNDEMVLGMIMNPETPFEAVESQSDARDSAKNNTKDFESQFESKVLAKYKE